MTEPIKLMSEARQQQIVDAVKVAVDYHLTDELSADQAVAKSAKEASTNEHETRLMVEAFNTSKTLAHWRTADGEEKTAGFELADADQVLALAFPPVEKKAGVRPQSPVLASIPNYMRPTTVATTKVASANQPETQQSTGYRALHRSHDKLDAIRKTAQEHQNTAVRYDQQLHRMCGLIADHFKTAGALSGWPTFVSEARQLHGKLGEDLALAIEKSHGLDKLQARHGKAAALRTLPDEDSELHQMLKIAVLSAQAAAEERCVQQDYEQKLAAAQQQWDKQANLAGMATLGAMNRSLDNLWQPPATQPDVNIGTDVGLESEFGRARLQMALRDMMDEDDVLSEHSDYDPDVMAQAIQELAQTSPNILNQPMLLRQALRRHMEMGTTETHELEQIKNVSQPSRQQALMNPGAI